MNKAILATAGEAQSPTTQTKHKKGRTALPQRFKIQEFTNRRTGSTSWRVSGIKRDGERVRQNFSDLQAAQCRQVELEGEHLARETDTAIRATKLTDAQVKLAEAAFARLDADSELLLAVDYWRSHGRQHAVAESPRIDEAFKVFKEWLDTANLRDRTKGNLRTRVNVFVNSIGNMRVSDITPEVIDSYLDKRSKVSVATKINDRLAVSRFFSWCMERKRRWTAINPCHAVRLEKDERPPPAVLDIEECGKLLRAAERHRRGRLAPYVAVCLFGGLRPFEAARLTPAQVNLKDREIRLEANQTKTKRPRVVAICETLASWLEKYKGKPFYPANWRKDFDKLKVSIGYDGRRGNEGEELKPWPDDVLRHTAISHYFRKTGSYGQTAEQFGNSEGIIKKHYQSRVSSKDTKRFYALRPMPVKPAKSRTKRGKALKPTPKAAPAANVVPLSVEAAA